MKKLWEYFLEVYFEDLCASIMTTVFVLFAVLIITIGVFAAGKSIKKTNALYEKEEIILQYQMDKGLYEEAQKTMDRMKGLR